MTVEDATTTIVEVVIEDTTVKEVTPAVEVLLTVAVVAHPTVVEIAVIAVTEETVPSVQKNSVRVSASTVKKEAT